MPPSARLALPLLLAAIGLLAPGRASARCNDINRNVTSHDPVYLPSSSGGSVKAGWNIIVDIPPSNQTENYTGKLQFQNPDGTWSVVEEIRAADQSFHLLYLVGQAGQYRLSIEGVLPPNVPVVYLGASWCKQKL